MHSGMEKVHVNERRLVLEGDAKTLGIFHKRGVLRVNVVKPQMRFDKIQAIT